jgi:hypothetical protein
LWHRCGPFRTSIRLSVKPADLHENIDSTLVILQNRLNGRAGNPEIQVIKNYGDIPPVECYGGSLKPSLYELAGERH